MLMESYSHCATRLFITDRWMTWGQNKGREKPPLFFSSHCHPNPSAPSSQYIQISQSRITHTHVKIRKVCECSSKGKWFKSKLVMGNAKNRSLKKMRLIYWNRKAWRYTKQAKLQIMVQQDTHTKQLFPLERECNFGDKRWQNSFF